MSGCNKALQLTTLSAVIVISCGTHGGERVQYTRTREGAIKWEILVPGEWKMPSANVVHSMTFELYNHPLGQRAVESTAVNKEEYARVLAYFDDCELSKNASAVDIELGTLKIIYESGNVMRVSWYQSDHTPLCFSINGLRLISNDKTPKDGGMALDYYFRKLSDRAKK